jgi:lysophospholipase L1-like esterase
MMPRIRANLRHQMSQSSFHRGNRRRFLDTLVGLAMLAGLPMGYAAVSAQSPAMTPAPIPAPAKSLIIIGASYAADWGIPSLPGYVVTNKGMGGQESTAVLARFDNDVIAAKPDAVLIWGHINDIFRAPRDQLEPAKSRAFANYRTMIERARAAEIDVLLATEVTLTVGDSWIDGIRGVIGRMRGRENYREMINKNVKDVNSQLRAYAGRNKILVLDFEAAVDSGNGSRREEFSLEDGSHISPQGYDALTSFARRRLTTP